MYRTITHPLMTNYGGILQAYALQTILRVLGISNNIVHYKPHCHAWAPMVRGFRSAWKYWAPFIKNLFSKQRRLPDFQQYSFLHTCFFTRFLKLWKLDIHRRNLLTIPQEDAFIVGSDQVWRGEYTRSYETLPFYFLDFATQEQRQRSIAYAASFGTDEWEGTPEETAECARLLKDFKAVSVREHSGIRICRDVFGVEAVQMPDPTLLLEAADYSRVIRRWWTRRLPEPFMAVYLLDETEEKCALTQAVAGSANLYPQQLTAHGDAARAMDRIPLSVPQWLRCMRDCECLLTDSFHGCVFAIIFNKPFICLGNEARGSARFDSLLGTFGLQERLLTNPTAGQVAECMRTPIDWERVNAIRHSEQQRAFDFLKQNLEKD